MDEEMIRLTAADGVIFGAFQARPAEPRGGLVVLQEIFGVGDQLKSTARDFAAEGYATVVPALFDRVSPNTVIPYSEAERGRELLQKLDMHKVMLDIAAAIQAVDHGKGVSVLGYCWGGGLAIRAAGHFDLTCAVAYYGTALHKHLDKGARCPTLLHFGSQDTHSPPETIELVKEKIPAAEIHLYQAGHAFANAARATYVPEAAKLANERTLAFLKKCHHAA